MSNQTIPFSCQITLPVPATNEASPVRLAEFNLHVSDTTLHLPSGGAVGQVLVVTETGFAWKYPVITDTDGVYALEFVDSPS